MPKSGIHPKSPHVIRVISCSGHGIVDRWTIEWHLPDRIIDSPINPNTNLPLIHDFVWTSAEEKGFQDSLKREGITGSTLSMVYSEKPGPASTATHMMTVSTTMTMTMTMATIISTTTTILLISRTLLNNYHTLNTLEDSNDNKFDVNFKGMDYKNATLVNPRVKFIGKHVNLHSTMVSEHANYRISYKKKDSN